MSIRWAITKSSRAWRSKVAPAKPWLTQCVRNRSRASTDGRSEEHTSELQSLRHLVCRLLLEKIELPNVYLQFSPAYGGGIVFIAGATGTGGSKGAVSDSAPSRLRAIPAPYYYFFFLIYAAPPEISPLPHHTALGI